MSLTSQRNDRVVIVLAGRIRDSVRAMLLMPMDIMVAEDEVLSAAERLLSLYTRQLLRVEAMAPFPTIRLKGILLIRTDSVEPVVSRSSLANTELLEFALRGEVRPLEPNCKATLGPTLCAPADIVPKKRREAARGATRNLLIFIRIIVKICNTGQSAEKNNSRAYPVCVL